MGDDESHLPALALRVVYVDPPDLIELEARVVADGWSAITQAYTSPSSLDEEARRLLAWSARPRWKFALEAGSDNGLGWLSLCWYTTDRAGHVACHVQMVTEQLTRRPEAVRRLSLEFATEPALVERFARELISLAGSLTGEAVLAGV